MEAGKGVTEKKGTNDVVLQISSSQESFDGFSKNTQQMGSSPKSNLELTEIENLGSRVQDSTFATSASPEITKMSSIPNKPTGSESITRRKSLPRSAVSKPKSRLVEPAYPNDAILKEEKTQLANSNSPYSNSPNLASPSTSKVIVSVSTPREKDKLRSAPITLRKPGTPGGGEEDDEEVYKTAKLRVSEKSSKKWKVLVLIEWIAFVCIMGVLIASLTVHKLQDVVIWVLELWEWCVLVFVIFCGRLVTGWLMNIVVFLIERDFLLRKKVLYFVVGLKRSVQVFVWLALVLLAWVLLFECGVKRSTKITRNLNYITRTLASCLIGAAIWFVKTLLVKILASNFHVTRFFDQIQESIFHQYVLRTLSGPPLIGSGEKVESSTSTGQLNFRSLKKGKEKEEMIDVEKLKKMKQEKISAWTMKGLIHVIRGSGLSTISDALESIDDEEGEQKDTEITSEWEAKAAAYRIFRNVAKPNCKYIDEEDLLRFMKKKEVDNVLPLFEGAVETGKIKRSSLKNWLVKVYLERKSLAYSLNDAKTAIEELNKLVSGVALIVIIIVWLLLMGFLTTKVLIFISSQLLLVVFMFGNTAKTVFEAIIFVFVMHPFDVGDRCVIDGVQMVVEEMNILTTVFLRYDNEKIFYPNSVLLTKPISNFYRSPEMSDSVEFAIDVSTSLDSIGAMKAKIKVYLESKPQHWRPNHSVVVKEIEDVNKMKIGLYVNHTINFQNYGDRNSRRSELVLELKKIFEELSIKYHLLPQEVHLSYVGSAASAAPAPAW